MKLFIKIFALITIILTSVNSCYALSTGKLDKLLSKSDLNETATISISIRNTANNKIVYEKDSKKLLHPASTLKLITTYYAVNSLGYDYFFRTGFYTDSNNNLYIKLGADPTLTTAQLKSAIQQLKAKNKTTFNNLYIDDSIIDKKEFSTGWMWDDDINPYTPKVSAYNLDRNVMRINITKDINGSLKAANNSKYPTSIFSYIKNNNQYDYIDVNRYNWNNPELIEIYGNIKNPQTISIPISSMRRYFIYNLGNALEDNRITIKSTQYASKLLPTDAELLYEIINPISPVIPQILKNSNNLMAETIFKLAGGQKYQATGNDDLSVIAMEEFYKNLNIDFNSVIIKDGCGVSRNNLLSTDWLTDALDKIYKDKNFESFKENMAQSGDGTLSDRLLNLRGEVWLKTGSLANISSIAGFVNSQDGNTYTVSIYIQNFKQDQKEIKNFEDEIITLIYNR